MTGTPAQYWFKATASSSSSSCVEVSFTPTGVQVRDSKYQRDARNDVALQPIITLAHEHWTAFLAAVENPTARHHGLPTITCNSDGGASISDGRTTLTYTAAEWDAFRAGVQAGEFDRVEATV